MKKRITKIIIGISVSITAGLLVINVFLPSKDQSVSPDEAVFEYRDLFKKQKKHQPDRLKKIVYMQATHEDPDVRRSIAEAVGELDEPDIDFLWNVIINEPGTIVDDAALEGLCLSKDKAVIKYLVKLLDS